MKQKLVVVVFILSPLLFGCKKRVIDEPVTPTDSTIKIAVVSDIHYMHPSLLVNGGEGAELVSQKQ